MTRWLSQPPALSCLNDCTLQHERTVIEMDVLMIQSKLKAESVADVRAAVDKMVAAVEAEQPEGLRYGSLLLPDGETLVALLQLDDASHNPLQALPEYQELLEVVEGVRAAPPVVQRWTVTGSYRLF
jgi:hypothetical protein